jgi:hypothetical protein
MTSETTEKARTKIMAELHRLLDEQMETLRGKLGPQEVIAYVRRKKQIDALIELLGSAAPNGG